MRNNRGKQILCFRVQAYSRAKLWNKILSENVTDSNLVKNFPIFTEAQAHDHVNNASPMDTNSINLVQNLAFSYYISFHIFTHLHSSL